MKRITWIIAALAAMTALSCSKEDNNAPREDGIHVRMEASVEEAAARVSLSGTTLAWEIGDELKCRWNNGTYESTTDFETLTATAAGASVDFDGTFKSLSGQNLYYYASRNGAFNGATGIIFKHEIPATQTGQLTDLRNHFLFYGWKAAANITTHTETELYFTAMLEPFFSILKINLPAGLGVTSFTLTANSDIAGTVRVSPQRSLDEKPIGTSDCRIYRHDSDTQGNTITVSNGGSVLSGDVYVALMPDAFDSDSKTYYCSATSLSFTFTTGSGDITITRPLKSSIYNATVKDLGAVPASLKPEVAAGSLKLMEASGVVIGIDSYNAACTYYYETGESMATCATPTTSSTSFDPATGFTLATTGTSDSWYVKVLAHSSDSNYGDAVLSGYVRNWNLNSSSPVISAIEAVGTDTGVVDATQTSSDGLEVWRRTTSNINFEKTAARIALTSAHMAISCVAEHSTEAWIKFDVDKSTSVSSGSKRGYRLFYNHGNGVNTLNGNTTNASITSDGVSARVPVLWKLGSINAGDKFAIRGDGKHVWYATTFLEVL